MHREKLRELRELIENVGSNPGSIDDEDFRRRLEEVNNTVNELYEDAQGSIGEYHGHFYQHGLTSIPAWICNHIHYKMWDEITFPFLNTGLPTSTELPYFVRILHAKYGSTNLAFKIRKLGSVSSVT